MRSPRSFDGPCPDASSAGLVGDAPPEVIEAVTWMVNLRSDAVTARERQEFETWYRADPAHSGAWERLCASLARVDLVRDVPSPAGNGLGRRLIRKEMSRRRFAKAALLGGAVLAAAGLGDRVRPLNDLLADQATWTGERRRLDLAGGGDLVLGPRSAANLRSGAEADRIDLLAGDLFVTLGAARLRPLHITLGDWRLEPTAGRVSLHRDGLSLRMSGLDAPVRVFAGGRHFTVEAAQTLAFADGALRQGRIDPEVEAAWAKGLLILRDGRLAGVVHALQPYFVGLIRISPAAAAVRVAGVFDLGDPRGTLVTLAEGFPITVESVTPFWLSVDARA